MATTAAAPVRFLLLTAVFAVVCCQAPLYYSNQNQYFLHGLACAGEGLLRDDWLAGTRDPTPVFSGLVAFTTAFLHPWMFYLYFALLQGAYLAAMLALFRFVAGAEAACRRWPVFLLALLVVHSALARWASFHALGVDYPYYFQAGVAGQYILGPGLQPSAFGVLLVVAAALFVHGRPWLAVACIAAAATLHSTYLLPGGLLTAGFLGVLAARREYRRALLVGAVALALIAPVTAFVLLTFAPTTPELFHQAAHVLVNFRIPHHCRPDLWFDPIAALQIGWIVLAVWLARGTALGPVLGVPLALAAALTVAQVVSQSDALALLFPWRISSVLVPIATAIVLSHLITVLPAFVEGRAMRGALALGAACLAAGGVWIMWTHQGYQANDNELGVLEYVRSYKAKGDVYFIPVNVPKLAAATHGSVSSDFKPLSNKRADPRILSYDLQRFRLPTGAALYVDFKSIPYQDIDVMEWRQRIDRAEVIQNLLRQRRGAEALDILRREGVTNLVWPAAQDLPDSAFEQKYADPYYRVYRLRTESD